MKFIWRWPGPRSFMCCPAPNAPGGWRTRTRGTVTALAPRRATSGVTSRAV
jgi:hypothetical protein